MVPIALNRFGTRRVQRRLHQAMHEMHSEANSQSHRELAVDKAEGVQPTCAKIQ